MANTENKSFEKKLFKVARDVNVSTDRIKIFLREKGYKKAIDGSGFNASIVDKEAYLILRTEFADDDEAAARLRELRSTEGNDETQSGKVSTLEEKKGNAKGNPEPPETGTTVTAVVKGLHSDYGAFVSVDSFHGRIRKEELAWRHVETPGEIVETGEEVECTVLDVKRIDGEQKLELSRKELLPSPWEKYKEGDVVEGTVVNLTDFGAFIGLKDGGTGLIHKSEISWTGPVDDPENWFEEGQEVKVRIISLDEEEERIGLSKKKIARENSVDISDMPGVGSEQTAEVLHFDAEEGLLVQLEPGIGGCIRPDEIYWDRIPKDPTDMDFARGDEIDVVVVDLNEDGPRVTLSHKRTGTNPWQDYAARYTEGSVHEAEVLNVTENNVVARLLPDGPEIHIHWKKLVDGFHLEDEEDPIRQNLAGHYEEGDQIQVRVRRFDADKEAIYVSERAVEDEVDETWRSYAERFYQGSKHVGVVSVVEEGGTMDVQLPNGPEAILPRSLLRKKPEKRGIRFEEGDRVPTRVHHFSLKNKTVVLEELDSRPEHLEETEPVSDPPSISEKLIDAVLQRVQPEIQEKVENSFSHLKEKLLGEELPERISSIVEQEVQSHTPLEDTDDAFESLSDRIIDELRETLVDEVEDLVEKKVEEWYQVSQEEIHQLKNDLREAAEDQKNNLQSWIERQEKKLHGRHRERIQDLREAVSLSLDDDPDDIPKRPDKTFSGEESDLIEHIIQYVAGQGLYYEDEVIENFYTCLKCDPLVILAGLSGVGKSKLPQYVANSIGGAFRMVPVRPNWNDDRDLLGYFNPRTGAYQSTIFLDTLIEANSNPDQIYIICLDEMNLASPEYYFALFLSKLESDDSTFHPDPSLSREVLRSQERSTLAKILELEDELSESGEARRDSLQYQIKTLRAQLDELNKYYKVEIPPNVKFVGTVNIDHTTEGFSDKVLDRANVIQFDSPDLSSAMNLDVNRIYPQFLSYSKFQQFASVDEGTPDEKPLSKYAKELRVINDDLEGNLGFGHRVYNSIMRYMRLVHRANYHSASDGENGLSLDEAFDLQLIQRVLPKMRGIDTSDTISSLNSLEEFLQDNDYKQAKEEVAAMTEQLRRSGYVNYWEV